MGEVCGKEPQTLTLHSTFMEDAYAYHLLVTLCGWIVFGTSSFYNAQQ